MNIIDISRDALKTEIYPGDPLPHAEFVSRIGEASDCNLSTLFSCVHTGTHADAPPVSYTHLTLPTKRIV